MDAADIFDILKSIIDTALKNEQNDLQSLKTIADCYSN